MWVRRRQRPRATLTRDDSRSRVVRRAARPPGGGLISWVTLALLTVGSVGSLGSAPALAVFGLASVFLYLLPAAVFLLPITLVAAELASGWPGGVYNWVEEGISAPMGLLAVWCEFAQTIFFYPALLAYVADTFAYVINTRLARNGVYTVVIIIVLFWGGVFVTSRGVRFADALSSTGTRAGTLIPGAILVALGAAYLLQGNHSAAPMTAQHLLPPWHGLASIVLVVNSFFTYAGIEVNAVHVNELRNPARDYPKSIFLTRQRDHSYRPAVRPHTERLACVLDLYRAGHAGVPDHVRADVHRGDEAAPFAAESSARLPGSGARPARRARHHVMRGRARDRVRPSVADRPLQPVRLRRPDTRRNSRNRDSPAAAAGPAAQAGMEGNRR
jgi:amino acid transporter